jgi:hypothetical protein
MEKIARAASSGCYGAYRSAGDTAHLAKACSRARAFKRSKEGQERTFGAMNENFKHQFGKLGAKKK